MAGEGVRQTEGVESGGLCVSEAQFVGQESKNRPQQNSFLPSAVVQTADIHHTLTGQSLTGTET